jgi:hypothetical protein
VLYVVLTLEALGFYYKVLDLYEDTTVVALILLISFILTLVF